MSNQSHLKRFLDTGFLTPNACIYFDPPLSETEMFELTQLFKNIRGKELITNPLRYTSLNEIKELLWLETNSIGEVSGWQNPVEYKKYEDGTEDEGLMTKEDTFNWYNRHASDENVTFVDGREFLTQNKPADLFDELNEGRLNEIGGKRAKDTHIVYRDENMLVLVPLSFESTKSFSRKTQYCTGGDCSKGSERTSKGMYNQHTQKQKDILFRIFFKDGTKVRLTWNGDINDKNFHWGLGKKDSYPTFTNRNMSNPFDLEQIREIRLEQLEIDFETEPKEKEFDEWEKKFCRKWGWDVHSLWDVYQKIREKWGFPDFRSGETKPMDPEKFKKMQEEEGRVYDIYTAKKKEIFGKYYGKTAWWNDGHEMLYKAITRIPQEAITKMVEYTMSGKYKPQPVEIREDVHLQDNIKTIKPGDKIWISRINPKLGDCTPEGIEALADAVGEICNVVEVSDSADLCQEDDEMYEDYGILIQNPKIKGHDGHGNSSCKRYDCYWINSFYATFTKGEPFDTHGAFETLYEQDGDDEFSWVTDIGLPKDLSVGHLGKHTITKLRLEDIQQGAMIRRYNGKYLYEIGEPSQFNIGGVMQPGYILKNLSTGKNYFTKTSQMLREFYLISN